MQNPTRILQYTVRDAMRSYAHLIFTLFVLHARAATIPDNVAPELEKKLTEVFNEAVNDQSAPAVSVLTVQEQIDEVNPVKDSDNKLKSVQPIENIPVTIIEENVQPLLKRDGEDWSRNNEVAPESENVFKRVEIDLAHPGVPERQEHETQNPEQFDDEKLSTLNIRQAIADAQNAFNQGLQGVGENIQSFLTNNNQIANIQNSIQNLQKSFSEQIEKLNETFKKLWKPPGSQTRSTIDGEQENTQLEQIQTDLKSLKDRFDTGINNLALGVQNIGSLKADGASPSNPSSQPDSGGFGGFIQSIATTFQNFQNQMSQGFNNVFNNVQNISQQSPSQTNNDSPDNNGPGGLFQSWIQGAGNIFNFQSNQQQSGTTQSGQDSGPFNIFAPIYSAFQNNPISQFISNLNKPSTSSVVQQSQSVSSNQQSSKPTQAASSKPDTKPDTKPESSNEASKPSGCDKCDSHKPEKPDEDDDNGDSSDDSRRKETTPKPSSPRPVIDAIQRNPIVKGISDAVQRLQGSVTPVEKQRIADEESSKKIPFGGGGHGGGHGGDAASGDNNGSVGLAEEIVSVKEKSLPTKSSSTDIKGAEGIIEEIKPIAEKTE